MTLPLDVASIVQFLHPKKDFVFVLISFEIITFCVFWDASLSSRKVPSIHQNNRARLRCDWITLRHFCDGGIK